MILLVALIIILVVGIVSGTVARSRRQESSPPPISQIMPVTAPQPQIITETVILAPVVVENEPEPYDYQGELDGLREYLQWEPADRLVNLVAKSGTFKGELQTLTVKQFRDLTGETPKPSSLTPDGKHIRWEYTIDGIATELGYECSDILKQAIEDCVKARARIRELERMVV